MKNNIWILTEERPKRNIIGKIIELYLNQKKIAGFINTIRILPLIDEEKFTFIYKISGLDCNKIDNIYLKIVSGKSSFVDYLVFDTTEEPSSDDIPVFVIEETKTSDNESRNTGVFQRATKFSYVEFFYPKSRKIMLYNLQGDQKKWATDTNIFGTRCFLTNGVEIIGKELEKEMVPWNNIDELISFKSKMRKPPKGNVPIEIIKHKDKIVITGRLVKSDRLSHDPNIGALLLITNTLRNLGWRKRIIIEKHGLKQRMLTPRNKFIRVANKFDLELNNLLIPKSKNLKDYWYYDIKGEKIGTIFLHLLIEEFSEGMSIYENHAGCERGYFISGKGEKIAVQKYTDQKKYKLGDKNKIVNLPDLTLIDINNQEIINVEGEMFQNASKGIEQLKGFDSFENLYIKKYYPKYLNIRTVVLYGSADIKKPIGQISLLLNKSGDILFSINAPKLFLKAFSNLRQYSIH